MLADHVDRSTIEKMVRQFYRVLIKDEIVGAFFIKALGDDLRNGKWYEHFNTLDNFWVLLMTGEKGYVGDPLLPHVFLGEIPPKAFEIWLKIFNETVHDCFIPKIAQKFYKKGEILASQFQEELKEIHEDED